MMGSAAARRIAGLRGRNVLREANRVSHDKVSRKYCESIAIVRAL
jgi:hypothetical protein